MVREWRLVFVPYVGMRHLIPAVELAKILINHHDGLSISVLIIIPPFDRFNIRHHVESMASSLSSLQRLHLVPLNPVPHLLDPHLRHGSVFEDHCIEDQKPNVRDFVAKLVFNDGKSSTPPLAGLLVDALSSPMIDVADEFGVPSILFFACGAAYLGFKLHTLTLKDDQNVDVTAFTMDDAQTTFNIPSFNTPVPVGVFPFLTLGVQLKQMFFNRAVYMKKATAILVNTFEDLEPHAIHSLLGNGFNVYPVGPIINSDGQNNSAAEGWEVMTWLDAQPPSSVVFLCFGDWGHFRDGCQVREIARALERSGVHFLWSLRKPPPEGSSQQRDYSHQELLQVLPEGFMESTQERGRLIGWAPQAHILAHKAVGGFVSSCGWHSIMESVHHGVPIATWPQFSDQQLNAFQLIREMELGVEISLDYRRGLGDVVSEERIVKGIREVMEEDSEVRKKVKEMSEISKRALMEGGSSYTNLRRFFTDILSQLNE